MIPFSTPREKTDWTASLKVGDEVAMHVSPLGQTTQIYIEKVVGVNSDPGLGGILDRVHIAGFTLNAFGTNSQNPHVIIMPITKHDENYLLSRRIDNYFETVIPLMTIKQKQDVANFIEGGYGKSEPDSQMELIKTIITKSLEAVHTAKRYFECGLLDKECLHAGFNKTVNELHENAKLLAKELKCQQ